MKIATYPTNLTDAQWELIKPMLPEKKKRGRPRICRRLVLNAIFYIVKGGIQWRMLPNDFRPGNGYSRFRKWQRDTIRGEDQWPSRAKSKKECEQEMSANSRHSDSQRIKSNPILTEGGGYEQANGSRAKAPLAC